MAILVKTLAILMNYKSSKASSEEISALARQGSGSACRSIYGGFAEWIAESTSHKEIKSHGVQIKDEKYWENFNISLLIVSDKKKDKGSTDGMRLSGETSEFLKFRVEKILPQRLELMRKSINDRNFDEVAEITMRDSNNFHSVCRDTFPTITYLNETSEFLIRCVDNLNNYCTEKLKLNRKFVCAYSFDAGPNCFIFYLDQFKNLINFYFESILFNLNAEELNGQINNLLKGVKETECSDDLVKELCNLITRLNSMRKENEYIVKDKVNFKPGQGAYLNISN